MSFSHHSKRLLYICSQAVTGAIHKSYTLVLFSRESRGEYLRQPDDTIGTISQVASITPLNDGSWELLVLKAYLPFFAEQARRQV